MKKLATIIAATLLLSGCAVGMSPVSNGLITMVDGPIMATENTVATKTGMSCAQNVLGIVAFGDASIAAAKKSAGITKIATADYKTQTALWIYAKTCTIVTGE